MQSSKTPTVLGIDNRWHKKLSLNSDAYITI